MYVKYAIKVSSGTRTCKCTADGTRCHGSYSSGREVVRYENVCSSVPSLVASITTHATHLVILLESRSTFGGSTVDRGSGCVQGARKGTRCSPTTRRTSRHAEPVATRAIAAVFFHGNVFEIYHCILIVS
jgi:hypothetical protein